MRVICVDSSRKPNSLETFGGLVEGKIYTVLKEGLGEGKNGHLFIVYVLEGMSQTTGYDKSRFIPLSGIDETELATIKETVHG